MLNRNRFSFKSKETGKRFENQDRIKKGKAVNFDHKKVRLSNVTQFATKGFCDFDKLKESSDEY